MSGEQIKEIEPVVKEVCDLVHGQVEDLRARGGVVSGIILVGGFGQSDFLYRRLKQHFGSAAPPPYSERPTHANAGAAEESGSIDVMQPVYAWTAVVRGAVLRGLEGSMVISRKWRMHYGTSYATVYDEDKHLVGERYWSPLWERWMVSDRMQWHIAKVRLGIPPVSPRDVPSAADGRGRPGRGAVAAVARGLPLHAQLPAGPVAGGGRRPHRVRRRRAAGSQDARPGQRVHADDGPQRGAARAVYAPDDDARRRV